MTLSRRSLLRAACAPAAASLAMPAFAKPDSQALKFGQSAPLSGGSGGLGKQLAEGTRACFAQVNAKGGVRGRDLELLTLDDAYDPRRTVENTNRLIETCMALTGYYGTPTVAAVSELIEQRRIPLVGFVSGAAAFRNPVLPMHFNVRASYDAEIEKMIEHNLAIGISRFAILYQDDSFGKPCLAKAQSFLKRKGYEAPSASIQRNSENADAPARALAASQPQAILVFTTLAPAVKFVGTMRQLGRLPQFMMLSPIGAEDLSKELGAVARGIGITQVFPHPRLRKSPVVGAFLNAASAHGIEPSYYRLEGYLNARVIVEGLMRVNGVPTGSALAKSLEGAGVIDLRGFAVNYSAETREGSRFVELTVVGEGGLVRS